MSTYLLDMSIISGGAGTKEWLAAIGGSIISSYEPSVLREFYCASVLLAAPLSPEQIELGRKVASRHGFTE
jgi:hypothetical protein